MMKFSNKVLEQRRLALQTYLQVSTVHVLIDFRESLLENHTTMGYIYFPLKLGTKQLY